MRIKQAITVVPLFLSTLLLGCQAQAPLRIEKAPPPEIVQKGDIREDKTVPFDLGVAGAGAAKPELVTREPVDEHFPAIHPTGGVLLFNTIAKTTRCRWVRYRSGSYKGRPLFGWRRRIYSSANDVTINGVDPNTGARRTLYTRTGMRSWTPAWLPNGRAFVYASNAPGTRSLVRSLSSSPNAAITVVIAGNVAPGAGMPAVSPNGKRVAFQTRIRGSWQVAVSNLDGARFTILGRGKTPSWSPDGKRIVYTKRVSGYRHIFVANADAGTNLVQVTSGPNNDYMPRYSPNGTRIVFASNRGWQAAKGTAGRTLNLYVIKPDGSGLTQLTTGSGRTYQPNWGADGWIYFSSNAKGNYDIWRMKPPPSVGGGG